MNEEQRRIAKSSEEQRCRNLRIEGSAAVDLETFRWALAQAEERRKLFEKTPDPFELMIQQYR